VCREYLHRLCTSTDDVDDKAAIILIGSTAGKYGEANHGHYAVSKTAVMYGLARPLKSEIVKIAPRGHINCIALGWVHR
ncbi:uncharacterized protein EDB91DRAFT_1065483, partial [Suillus paluster]|uniref:uncharacterized protein n=1 Tax=Suillus paluster TaxID=48578 RepID=UPI001B8759CB